MQSAIDHVVDDRSPSDFAVGASLGISSRIRQIEKESRIASFSAGHGTRVCGGPSFPEGEDASVRGNTGVLMCVFISQTELRREIPAAPGGFSGDGFMLQPANRPDASLRAGQTGSFPELKNHLLETSQYFSAKIVNEIRPRIVELEQDALEEKSEGQLPLSSDSYRGMARFLNKIVDTGMYLVPELDLTYSGNIRAEWESSDDEFLILEFVDFFRLKFVFFHPDSLSSRTLRISGDGSVSDFLDHHPRAMEFLRGLCG